MRNVVKRYGDVLALDGARLEARAGEVHGVLGENGAGKSTLLSILAGLRRPDAGDMALDGAPFDPHTPRDAWRRGVGMVHQHFALIPRLTVLENLALGRRRRGGFGLPTRRTRTRALELASRTGLDVPLDRPVEELGVGHRQRAEILKVLLRDPAVLALDEPTAVLSPPEVRRLSELLRSLAAEGRAVLLVAHKLDEVLAVADRVTVLRHGRTVLEAPRSEVDAGVLARAMVGVGEGADAPASAASRAPDGRPGGARAPEPEAARDPGGAETVSPGDPSEARVGAGRSTAGRARQAAAGPRDSATGAGRGSAAGGRDAVVVRLSAVGLGDEGAPGGHVLRDVDLEVRRGEIVGVAGVEGNGQRELALVLAGRLTPERGVAEVPPEPGFIPQDRSREGLVAPFTLTENLALALHRDDAMRRGPLLRWGPIRKRAVAAMERYGIRAPGPDTRAAALSGGNQQRVVVARELAVGRDLLVAENPTRGLDVAAAAFVHARLRELVAGEGAPGVVLLSTDLDEVLELAHRVLVMVRGRLVAVPEERRTREGVGRLMLGVEGDA